MPKRERGRNNSQQMPKRERGRNNSQQMPKPQRGRNNLTLHQKIFAAHAAFFFSLSNALLSLNVRLEKRRFSGFASEASFLKSIEIFTKVKSKFFKRVKG
jgi:hypothetical protein